MHRPDRAVLLAVALLATSCSKGDRGAPGVPAGGTWSSPSYFAPPGGFTVVSVVVRVGVDSTGGGMVFWQTSYDTGVIDYRYSRYTPGSGWSEPVMFEPGVSINPTAIPELGMQGDGEAVLAWYSPSGSIYVARAAPGGDFAAATAVAAADTPARDVRLQVRESGEAVLAWARADAIPAGVLRAWASVYTPGSGWSAAAPVENATAAVSSGSLRAAADGIGGALAVWREEDSNVPGVWANRYTAGTGWDTLPYRLDLGTFGAGQPDVAAASDGRALAAWMQPDDAGYLSQVYTTRFDPLGGWAGAQPLRSSPEATTYSFPYPKVAMNDLGDGLAVWRELDRTTMSFAAYGSDSAANGVWQAPSLLDGALGYAQSSPESFLSTALSGSGSGMAIWLSGSQIRASACSASGAWAEPVQLSSGERVCYQPTMAMNDTGQGIAAWVEVVSGYVQQVAVSVLSGS